MKMTLAAGLSTVLLGATMSQAQAFEDRVTVSALAGTTGAGADISWRLHQRFGITAQYAGGLEWDGDYETDEVNYEGDLDISAAALKVDFHPFGGRFYVTAGAMLPDMEANVRGSAKDNQAFEFDGNTYTTAELGTVHGQLTVADGVQPYAGLGWRSSHTQGLSVFSELGVMAVDVAVDLRTSNDYESRNDEFREDLRREEQTLKDDADELPFYPVAVLGISYTF